MPGGDAPTAPGPGQRAPDPSPVAVSGHRAGV